MKKYLLLVLAASSGVAFACSDIFINKNNYHVVARSLDFPINMGNNIVMGFVNQKNITNPVVNAAAIPKQQLTSWTNKYGYVGRVVFNTPDILDGINTQGLSSAALYLPGTKYPEYNPTDKRPVLSIFELGSYLLSQAKDVNEAYQLINAHQLVTSAVEYEPGVYVKNIPTHFVFRDKTGHSVVVEFIDGKVVTYKTAGNVLTNAPSYDWQLDYVKHYSSINVSSESENPAMRQYVYKYDEIYPMALRPAVNNFMGMPGDYGSTSRFVRASLLLNNMYAPSSSLEARYQANMVLNSVIVPYTPGDSPKTKLTTTTLWTTIKDLDNLTVSYHDIAFFQGNYKLLPMDINQGYITLDLKAINFNTVPNEFEHRNIMPANLAEAKIVDVSQLPGF